MLSDADELVAARAVAPDVDGLRGLADRVAGFGEPVLAAVANPAYNTPGPP